MRVEFLGIADGDTFVTRSIDQLLLTFEGIPGDRHAGLTRKSGVRETHLPRGSLIRNARQLSLLSLEELAQTATALNLEVIPGHWCGANVVFSGLEGLTQLPPSTRLVFPSGASVVIDGENLPCTQTGRSIAERAPTPTPALASRYVKAAMHRRGLVAWVEREGQIRLGDLPTIHPR